MTEDGQPLYSTAHPRGPWWKSAWLWVLGMLGRGLDPNALEEVTVSFSNNPKPITPRQLVQETEEYLRLAFDSFGIQPQGKRIVPPPTHEQQEFAWRELHDRPQYLYCWWDQHQDHPANLEPVPAQPPTACQRLMRYPK